MCYGRDGIGGKMECLFDGIRFVAYGSLFIAGIGSVVAGASFVGWVAWAVSQ